MAAIILIISLKEVLAVSPAGWDLMYSDQDAQKGKRISEQDKSTSKLTTNTAPPLLMSVLLIKYSNRIMEVGSCGRRSPE